MTKLLFSKTLSFSLIVLLFLAISFPVLSMIQKQTPEALIANSLLIVDAKYIGTKKIVIDSMQRVVGVLHVIKTLKGIEREIIYLQLPESPVSDFIALTPNQAGLWLFENDTPANNLFKVNNPQRIIPYECSTQFIELLNTKIIDEKKPDRLFNQVL